MKGQMKKKNSLDMQRGYQIIQRKSKDDELKENRKNSAIPKGKQSIKRDKDINKISMLVNDDELLSKK